MSGEWVGVSGGAGVGWPGCAGSGTAGVGVVGGSLGGGTCCTYWSPLPWNARRGRWVAGNGGLPIGRSLL